MAGTDLTGYFDVQTNGYAGVDFNSDDLTAAALREACLRLRSDSVRQILATVITDDLGVMCRRLENLAQLCAADALIRDVVAGIHVEGPFISPEPGYVGAHPPEAVRPATRDAASRLVAAGGGLVRLVTLAPEQDADGSVTRFLAEQSICVSAGHTNCSLEQLRRSIDAGLTMFTHLGNGCPLLMHRHDNIIQRALGCADRLWIGFIADGVHVPFVALKNYLKLVGPERAIVVSDAIAAAGQGPGTYTLAGQQVVVDERLATWAADKSHLVGSACTMRHAADNLQRELDCTPDLINRLMNENPRRALGL